MNDSPEDPTARKVVAALRDWESDVDATQRVRLAAARRLALASTASARRAWPTWSGAVAALLLLALGMHFWPQATTTPDAAVLQATLETSLEARQFDAVEVQEAELLLDEDLDFYLWLIGDAKAT